MNSGNPNGNPDIALIGKDTRFGQPGGADPAAAREKQVNPSSVRSCLRRLMTFPFSPDKEPLEQLNTKNLLTYLGHGHKAPTLAMLAAIQTYMHGVKNGKIMMNLIEQVDGKLIEKSVSAVMPFSDIVKGSMDQQEEGDVVDQRTPE